jgi:hypothetical protein
MTPTNKKILSALAAAAGAVLLFVGLSGGHSSSPGTDQMERDIRTKINQQQSDFHVSDVVCPPKPDMSPGSSFRCEVSTTDEDLPQFLIEVHIEDSTTYTWKADL